MNNNRLTKILKKMKEQNINQAIISDPYSIFYLTGYFIHPGERLFALILDTNTEHKLIVNELFPIDKNINIETIIFNDTDNPIEILSSALTDGNNIGVDKILPARFLLPIINTLKNSNFVDISLIVDTTRMIKDEEEINFMRDSSKLNDLACEMLQKKFSKDKTETDMVKELLAIYDDLGVDALSFPPIIAFGANGANPHAEAGKTKLKDGDAIIIDMGGIKNNYCSDMTRTVFWKKPSKKAEDVFNIVLEAQKRAVAVVKPGVKFSDIDRACRDYITEKGYGEFFTHRTGHHIGLECHEYGDISSTNDTVCRAGMIFSIEPGVYLPNEFGVRIEDLILVTEDGYENLNKCNKELVVLGLE